jgi:hypothetical protein
MSHTLDRSVSTPTHVKHVLKHLLAYRKHARFFFVSVMWRTDREKSLLQVAIATFHLRSHREVPTKKHQLFVAL